MCYQISSLSDLNKILNKKLAKIAPFSTYLTHSITPSEFGRSGGLRRRWAPVLLDDPCLAYLFIVL